jgi:hypothetical protein
MMFCSNMLHVCIFMLDVHLLKIKLIFLTYNFYYNICNDFNIIKIRDVTIVIIPLMAPSNIILFVIITFTPITIYLKWLNLK